MDKIIHGLNKGWKFSRAYNFVDAKARALGMVVNMPCHTTPGA